MDIASLDAQILYMRHMLMAHAGNLNAEFIPAQHVFGCFQCLRPNATWKPFEQWCADNDLRPVAAPQQTPGSAPATVEMANGQALAGLKAEQKKGYQWTPKAVPVPDERRVVPPAKAAG